ncbi:nitrite reductase [Carbonactinospora thermoautotrophica]|uniref:molybdopterin oxidoreductase family protein n=1 Tax=Carbonactinospora thermoautotrophica TaxID=1469144 RepID=UPI00226D4F79|nr:molybdopterin oxidoreductase family protein [Carbonactinospora thermoautotrophica]MCX9191602.1 nitrite reductase [Carbonactinospora thermoautotrophica]
MVQAADHLAPAFEAATHCPYCALQCGMVLRRGEAGVTVQPRNFPTNRGGLCQKGWTSAELLTSAERLTTPLARPRKDADLEPVSWAEALDRVAAEIRRIRAAHGPDAVAVFGGGGLTNEKAYTLGKFARVALGTANIDYNGRFCMSSAAAAGIRAFGVDRGLPFPLADIAEADATLLAGSNVAETMPPFMRYLTEAKRRGGALIVVDPRHTPTAQQATLHLRVTPGTDLALANGLLHLAITEGYLDKDYIARRTTGFEEVRRVVAEYWPERTERITGVPVAQQREAVRLLAEAERAMILTARGAEQQSKGTDTVSALINLALALGLPGTPGSGYGCLTGQGNGQGGREHGQKADQLPGYRRIDDPAARAHVARVWGVDPDSLPGPGVSAYELLDALGTPAGPKALLLFGSNLVVSAPHARHVEERVRSLEFLAVADVVLSETARLADVVLPAAQWAEEEGTMTNLEGRVLRRRRLHEPPPGVRTDLEIIAALAARLGHGARFSAEPRAVFEELRRASAGGPADYSGITYERIEAEDGVFWPCPAEDHPGTPRMFLDRFATPDGRARFVPVEHREVAEDLDAAHPLYLTTGRVLHHYQSGAQTRRVKPLLDAVPEPFVELHPDVAERLGIAEDDLVRVVSRRGEATARARITDTIRDDTVFLPFHWGGAGRANSVTNPALDPTSRMPEFKVCAVRLEKLEQADAGVAP